VRKFSLLKFRDSQPASQKADTRKLCVHALPCRPFPQPLRIDVDDERRQQDQAADQYLPEREVRDWQRDFTGQPRGNSLRTPSGVQARIPIAGRNGGSSSGEGGIGAYRSNCIAKVARP